jgi:hypothetical protein
MILFCDMQNDLSLRGSGQPGHFVEIDQQPGSAASVVKFQ